MIDPNAKQQYRDALVQYAQAQEILEIARSNRSKALCALIESDFTLAGAVELALKEDTFYEMLKAWVLEYLGERREHAA
jgi:hypothetical protein